MKKGFTLVEVLAIIAVLGIILITVVPNIGGSIEKKKEEEYKKIINVIENAAKTYYSYNPNITQRTPLLTPGRIAPAPNNIPIRKFWIFFKRITIKLLCKI